MPKSKSRVHVSSDIPEDLMLEILRWVTVKSLMRFKCVSKAWLASIQNPLFTTSYQGGFKGLLLTNFIGIRDKRMDSTQPVNGLICFYDGNRSCIYNIATRETMSLPDSTSNCARCDYLLGFDPFHNVYKVFKVCRSLKIEILTVGVDLSWRSIDPAPWYSDSTVCYANGCLYWCCYENEGETREHLLCFNLVQEKFQFIEKPHKSYAKYGWFPGSNPNLMSCSWPLDEYGYRSRKVRNLCDYNNDAWTKHEILNYPLGRLYRPMSTLPNGKIVFIERSTSGWKFPMPFYTYDRNNREFKKCLMSDCPSSSSIASQHILDLYLEAMYYEENITPLSCLGSSHIAPK
ncbi:OLC1v1019037C1 [Oldenlandia corymbosa var. corymbosa]|uniref:OLC1v1019037C1 n=1 Tax=Oldenlandia corymbosa var. corymbosa TaxID=529605 RepID=A0AAV1ED18_OLDCO|nr:OLC1v1019037C1 [Oldenlandia corymbosa var. corymbosa]